MNRRDLLSAGMTLTWSAGIAACWDADRADAFALPAQTHPADDLDAMIARAYRGDQLLQLSPKRYRTKGVAIPPPGNDEIRGRPFSVLGAGAGEPFGQEMFQAGTVIEGIGTTGPVVHFKSRAARQGSGSIEWGKQRVVGATSAGTPLIKVDSLAGLNHLHDFVALQHGSGDGISAGNLITTTVQRFFVLNDDWAKVAAARSGTGFSLTPAMDFGLSFIANCTVRGFKTAYQIGDEQSERVLASKLFMPESAAVEDGIRVAASAEGLSIDTPYFEGVSGTCIFDEGRVTHIVNPYAVLSFHTGIDLRGDGGSVSGGYLGLRERDAVGIRIGGSPSGQGIWGCRIVWGAAGRGDNVRGIEIAQSGDPLLFAFVGFHPSGPWTGGRKVNDQSYSTAHGGAASGHGSGVIGLLMRESAAGATLPCLSRAAINLHVDARILSDGDIDDEGTLQLSAASVQRLQSAQAAEIRRLAAPNLPDKTGVLIVETGGITFRPSSTLKGIAEPLVFGPGELGVVHYQILPGSNASVLITAVHRSRRTPVMPAFTVAALRSIREGIGGPVLAGDGRRSGEAAGKGSGCPVWFDGESWRTFYDNQPVDA
ncbi:hypothetical protein GON01_08760 [Sphingomonas sp. MAH-20]|uniref:Uncharacterized protein n=1 Tax=Sphingomonas horti TaxID=2682842 RepID=A0A6I4J1Q1_9SPHN|nr:MULTISPECIES: hypothetical protein [Sphingomonas]MBA2919782.1 hypothetical protein [Sphingomonas sp. CGMCC 1.13658]MVO78023.1 hypothetical protein [Sphingomonas horti]